MLVLSRRLKEKIVFPSLNVTVQIVSLKGKIVGLGIEAPPEVRVLREELACLPPRVAAVTPSRVDPGTDETRFAGVVHQVRDRLTTTSVNLGMVQLLLDAGCTEDAKQALACLRDDLQVLRYGLDGELEIEPEKPAAAKKPLKALVVEDDGNQRELLASVLRMGGVEVETAGDGCDALDHLRSHARPDVVLLDMGLPRCDGATVVRTVRKDPAYAGLRIFAVTGRPRAEFDVSTGKAGVDRWFQKPLDPAALLEDLRGGLNSSTSDAKPRRKGGAS